MRRRGDRTDGRGLTQLAPVPLEPAHGINDIRTMNLGCLFGRHQPSLSSIARRHGGYAAICEQCARPLEKRANGRGTASLPVYEMRDNAA